MSIEHFVYTPIDACVFYTASKFSFSSSQRDPSMSFFNIKTHYSSSQLPLHVLMLNIFVLWVKPRHSPYWKSFQNLKRHTQLLYTVFIIQIVLLIHVGFLLLHTKHWLMFPFRYGLFCLIALKKKISRRCNWTIAAQQQTDESKSSWTKGFEF